MAHFSKFSSTLLILISFFFLFENRYSVNIYNVRKRGGDSSDKRFKLTDMIADIKVMRL